MKLWNIFRFSKYKERNFVWEYGFFGGSFNPVTIAHIKLAQKAIKQCKLDKVIFVPVGNSYKKTDLADEKIRYDMLKLVTDKYEKIEISDIELNSEKSLMPIEIFSVIQKMYNQDEIFFIMGADNLYKLNEELQKKYNYIIFERNGYDISEDIKNKTNFTIIRNEKYKNISATKVREKMKQKTTYWQNCLKEVY